jgi:hypothetical protein
MFHIAGVTPETAAEEARTHYANSRRSWENQGRHCGCIRSIIAIRSPTEAALSGFVTRYRRLATRQTPMPKAGSYAAER